MIVHRYAMWSVVRSNGIGGKLLQGVKSLYVYVGSKACVRVGNEVSDWFPVRGAETGMCDVAVAVQIVH